MWKRWYHVHVDLDGRRLVLAVEASSAIEARQRVATDWGEACVREVKSGGRS